MKRRSVVFTGQGSQFCGMGRDFYDSYPESRDVFERASDAIGLDMTSLCFLPNELLDQTEYTQPAILTTEVAMFTALQKYHDLHPLYFAGHSLGEYSALVAAGVLQLEDAVKIVRKRGHLMQCAMAQGSGAMAAIILENLALLDAESIVAESGAEIANFNSKDQVVISGTKESVSAACKVFGKSHPEARIVPLNVSAPFHSHHMNTSKRAFKKYLESFSRSVNYTNAGRVLSNYTGTFHSGPTLLGSLVSQIAAPVRWLDNMRLLEISSDEVYEVGPQRVLGKFFSSIGVSCPSIFDGRSLARSFANECRHAI